MSCISILGFLAVFLDGFLAAETPNVVDLAAAINGAPSGNTVLLGTSQLPAHSCRQIAEFRPNVDNGVYYIKSVVSGDSFPVYCDMANGGYTMVYKAVSGVAGDADGVWINKGVVNEEQEKALNTNNFFKAHYKNRIVDEWRAYRPKEVVVVLYKAGSEVLRLVFNGHLSTKTNWFTKQRLVFSPYTDLKKSSTNFFGIAGHPGRNWFINRNYGGCHVDAGWLVFYSPGLGCSWDLKKEFGIKYSRAKTVVNWAKGGTNVGVADSLAVFVD